jgi:hypothetical protein
LKPSIAKVVFSPGRIGDPPATTDQGEIFIAFLRDISHKSPPISRVIAARDKALAGEKSKTDFLSTMSHVRTPLNGRFAI